MDFYKALKIFEIPLEQFNADQIDFINKQYKKLAVKFHPDKYSSLGQEKQKAQAKELFQQLQHAKNLLESLFTEKFNIKINFKKTIKGSLINYNLDCVNYRPDGADEINFNSMPIPTVIFHKFGKVAARTSKLCLSDNYCLNAENYTEYELYWLLTKAIKGDIKLQGEMAYKHLKNISSDANRDKLLLIKLINYFGHSDEAKVKSKYSSVYTTVAYITFLTMLIILCYLTIFSFSLGLVLLAFGESVAGLSYLAGSIASLILSIDFFNVMLSCIDKDNSRSQKMGYLFDTLLKCKETKFTLEDNVYPNGSICTVFPHLSVYSGEKILETKFNLTDSKNLKIVPGVSMFSFLWKNSLFYSRPSKGKDSNITEQGLDFDLETNGESKKSSDGASSFASAIGLLCAKPS